MSDTISRQAAIDALRTHERKASKKWFDNQLDIEWNNAIDICCYDIEDLPSAQPDYQEVLGWLLAYHTMSFDLHGRYLPHEVISWLISDFTKEFIAERGQNG